MTFGLYSQGMSNAIDLQKFKKLIQNAVPARVLSMDLEYPNGKTFVGDAEPSEKFLASCERGILVPLIVDEEMHLIDGVKRAIGAFTAQLSSAPCLIIEKLTEMERLAFRVLINPDRRPTEWAKEALKGKANFDHIPNYRYRTEILKKAQSAIRRRGEATRALSKEKTRLNSTFLKAQVRIAELTAEAIHQLDSLIALYEEPPEQLKNQRDHLAKAVKGIVEFRQPAK